MLLENNNIRLRAVEPEDAGVMWDVETDSRQWIQNAMMAPISRQMLVDYALSYDADPFRAGQLRLLVERIRDKAPVGIADLYNISASHRNAFIAIYILPPYRHQGIATEAIALLENYAFKLLNIRHLCAKIIDDNEVSINLFCKCGYLLRGEIPEWYISGNKPRSLIILSKILSQNS